MLRVPLAAAAAGAAATTPYAALYDALAPARSIAAYDRLIAIEHVGSSAPGVRPEDIRITIRAKSGAIEVPVAADGGLEFPLSEALRAENPPVETNQPKGSLALGVNAALRPPHGLVAPWREIAAALKQADALYASASPPHTVRGIEVRFAPGAPATLTLGERSERLFAADADGRVIVLRDDVVDAEHATLAFSRPPLRILPYVE
ncbi:MAG TPA: hypothetical protein VGC30_12280 [Dokdonella sp.]